MKLPRTKLYISLFELVKAYLKILFGIDLKKGDKVYIEGKLRTRSWQDQEGNNRYTTEVIADNLTMLGKNPDNRQDNTASENTGNESKAPVQKTEAKALTEEFTGPDESSDDLPF